MEWIGTRFAITLGGIRLRVRIALEDAVEECDPRGKAPPSAREEREHDGAARRSYRIHSR